MYRTLEDGEILRRGDQYWFSGKWQSINPATIGCKIPLTQVPCPYQRKISARKGAREKISQHAKQSIDRANSLPLRNVGAKYFEFLLL